MRMSDVKKKYKDEWVLVEILREDELGNPIEVEVLAHSKTRDETYKALRNAKDKYVYHFYTGGIPKEGYAVAFYEDDI